MPQQPSTCSEGESGHFRCESGHCINSTSLCDLENDCCDRSDETYVLCTNYYRFERKFSLIRLLFLLL